MRVNIKRVYDPVSSDDGYRILVDRLWARGIRKHSPKINIWLKEIAPSKELMEWFHQDREGRWQSFKRKYKTELSHNKDTINEIKRLKREHNKITLVYGSRDTSHNNAIVLQKYLSSL